MAAVARDDCNILPIAFVVVKGETVDVWFFFLYNLHRYVTLKDNPCLIFNYHEAIKNEYSREA